ncbi:GNAT family N-acetyltransferase [Anaerovibrio sp. JC8]|uniref:GNAT family N-acetyltransferase n=1 Tax=Anaerovibrio sp. JC8 TaxID=1240085 RepID=UPI000A1121EF|nr:GNAT family N-acetyltransferase [Anaerovibrio sp. JC8]
MQYRIIDGAENLKINDVVRLLKMTYWAENRPLENIEKSMRNSACYGIYLDVEEKLVGFARVISDYATTYYLCDVIVDTAYQHMGLGTALVSHIEALPEYKGLRGVLITRDAHGLYDKFGYKVLNNRAMVKESKY